MSATSAAVEDARSSHPADKDHPTNFAANFPDRAAWEARADFLRHQALVALGLWPMPVKTPLNPVIHGRIDRDAYTIEKVFFASLPGHYVSGNLYRPKRREGKLAAVLCPYGHWPDGRFIWRSDADVQKELAGGAEADANAARSPLQANCAMLARMGCIVFQYDMVGYCDSTKIPHRMGFLDAQAILRLQSFMGLQTWNSIRALDFVLSLPKVDPDRIAVTGSSSGGTQTIALCATDPRPAVSFPMVMISMNMQGGCVCENAPLYRVGTNNVELASLFAPKPEGAAAANDWTRDFLSRGLPEMTRIWSLHGAADRIEGAHVNFGHNHNLQSRRLQYAFLNKHLKLGWPDPMKEEPFSPVPPKELSVYDVAHPMPADATDATGVRAYMTRASDEQLDALAKDDPSAYAAMLRFALQAMVIDELPPSNEVEMIESSGDLPSSSSGEWRGIISRKDAGERVPCKAIFPEKWNGRVIIWSHPQGCASMRADDDAISSALAHRFAVIGVDLFIEKEPTPTTRPASNPNPPYAGYKLGYNRTIAANRVHDLLTLVALCAGWKQTRSIYLAGFGDAGPTALLARVLAGDAIDRAAIDLKQFDFDRVNEDTDSLLLPGACKYGGIYAFASLCSNGATVLYDARPTGRFEFAARNQKLVIKQERAEPKVMIGRLMS